MNKRTAIYLAIILGSFAIALDFASIDLALPALENAFGLDLDSVQWVINSYVLAFSVLMVSGGRFADAYGRRRVFLLGMGIFALASLLGGLAWNGGSLIGFRVLQGIGAALLWPAMIGMACAAVGEANRGFALGLIFGTCSLGNAAGPVVGGALTEWFSWRWVLWINVPLALLCIVATMLAVPRDEPGGAQPKNDWTGMGLLTSGLVALMVLVYQGQSWGWTSPAILALGLASMVLLGAFLVVEPRVQDALVPSDLMRNPEFLSLCYSVLAICQVFFIVLLYFTQYAMKFLGDDPVQAGSRVVLFMLSYGVVSYFGGPLYKKLGARRLLLFGLAISIVASFLLGWFGPGARPVIFQVSLILLGIGVGAVIPNVSSRAIETVGVERASLVSGITFMAQLSGAAVIMAVNTAIFTATSTHNFQASLARERVTLTAPQQEIVQEVMMGAKRAQTVTAGPLSGVDHVVTHLDAAYQFGLRVILWFSGVVVLVALALVWRHVPPVNGAVR